jgi:hypothetical protein
MTNDTKKKALDDFESFEDGVEGQEQQGRGVIQGRVLKFTNQATWIFADDEARVPADLELVAIDIGRVVQKWLNNAPVETIILAPRERFPDVKAKNEAAPKSEWSKDSDGKPKGPWQGQHIVYLLNLATMDRYSYPTGTTGGAIAVRDLVDRTKWMRRLRRANVYPIVTLTDVFMNTRFGGRQRPHFNISKWIGFGDSDKALPAPSVEASLDQFAAGKQEPAAKQLEVHPIEPPSHGEMGDEIPSSGSGSSNDRKGGSRGSRQEQNQRTA